MNYTDTFFKFPKRIIDQFQIAKIEQEINAGEELPDNLPPIPSRDTVFCLKDYKDIIGYHSMVGPEQDFNDEYSCTLVQLLQQSTFEEVLCSWPRDKFEDKLNKHVELVNRNKDKEGVQG